jgi:hypothetical protein
MHAGICLPFLRGLPPQRDILNLNERHCVTHLQTPMTADSVSPCGFLVNV